MPTLFAVKLESNSNENFRFLTPKPVQKFYQLNFLNRILEKKTEVNGEMT